MKCLLQNVGLILSLILCLLVYPEKANAQANVNEAKGYIVDIIKAPLSISKQKLNKAKTLSDLLEDYKSDWVRAYLSVGVKTIIKGVETVAVGGNDNLNQEQIANLLRSDEGSDISITVTYIPENNLVDNDQRIMDFTFKVNPENHAEFIEGKLATYLEGHDIQDIVETIYSNNAFAAIKFTINETGKVDNVRLFESSRDTLIDNQLLQIVRNMPNWTPASYSSGKRVKQEMVLTAGNLESCVMNLLNFGKE